MTKKNTKNTKKEKKVNKIKKVTATAKESEGIQAGIKEIQEGKFKVLTF